MLYGSPRAGTVRTHSWREQSATTTVAASMDADSDGGLLVSGLVERPRTPVAMTRAQHWEALRREMSGPCEVPRGQGRLALLRYGFAQPLLGLRIICRSPALLGLSLAPALGVLVVGAIVGYSEGSEHGMWRGILAGSLAIAALAPLPVVLFGRVYAHLAAGVRPHLGLPPQAPYIRSVVKLVGEWLSQVLILALGVLPLTILLGFVPIVGAIAALVAQAIWSLHWVVVEGYDNARTLPPACTVEQLEELGRSRPGHAWFHRPHVMMQAPQWVITLLGPVRMLSEVVHSLARAWRIEVDVTERNPWISAGFGLGVVLLLAIPGVNLFFRPAVVAGGVHLRHRLFDEPAAALHSPRPSTQPYPTVS